MVMPQDLSPHGAGVSCLCKTLPKLTLTPKTERLLLQGKTLELAALITPIEGKNNLISQLILASSLAEMAAAEMALHKDGSNSNNGMRKFPAAQKITRTKCQPRQNNQECKSCRGAAQIWVPWPLELQAQALNRIEIINLMVEEHFAHYPAHPSMICSTERSAIIFAASENTIPSCWHWPRQQI